MWCNIAFERLTGYSLVELQQRTWMDLTVSEDVQGDLQSVQAVIDGKIEVYSLSKRYRHKRGHEVPVEITAWKYPRMAAELTCFLVEALPAQATHEDLARLHEKCMSAIKEIRKAVDKAQTMRDERKRADAARQDSHTINIGNNSVDAMKIAAGVIIALIAAVAYFAFIAGWPQHKGNAPPPHIHSTPHTGE